LRAHQLRTAGGSDGKFTNEDVIAARDPYSDYLLRELDDEIAKHVPDYEEHMEVLKTVGNIQFAASEFKQAWEGRPRLTNEEWQHGLESLFEAVAAAASTSGATRTRARDLTPQPSRIASTPGSKKHST
jgi:hypothetical protein